MSKGSVIASAVIDASPRLVYEIIADYRKHHPQIVPKQYFTKLDVEEGGFGAGTRTRIEVNVLGTRATLQHVITEPDPGRILIETDVAGSTVTTFTIQSIDEDRKAKLTISTQFRTQRSGALGSIEKAFTIFLLKRIYRTELDNIAAYAARLKREDS